LRRDLLGAPIGPAVGDGVAFEPVGAGVDEARPAAAPDLAHQLARGVVHGESIVAVEPHGRNPDRLGARRRAGSAGGVARPGEGRKAVVLAHEQDRQIEDPGPVEAFEERPAVDRAVAEEAGDDGVMTALEAETLSGADSDRDAARDDAVGAQHADIEIGDVHGAALATAGAGGAAEQLAHHRRGVGPFGDGVAVATMRAGDVVGALDVSADARRDPFLADREVERAGDLARL